MTMLGLEAGDVKNTCLASETSCTSSSSLSSASADSSRDELSDPSGT